MPREGMDASCISRSSVGTGDGSMSNVFISFIWWGIAMHSWGTCRLGVYNAGLPRLKISSLLNKFSSLLKWK